MNDGPKNADDRDPALPLAPNSDPTGGGPPPPGAETEVTADGHGVTIAPLPAKPAEQDGPAQKP